MHGEQRTTFFTDIVFQLELFIFTIYSEALYNWFVLTFQ